MNRRQEITIWLFGLVLAGISVYQGEREGEWIFETFVPVLLVGALLTFSLRDRPAPSQDAAELLKKSLGVVALVVLVGIIHHKAGSLASEVQSTQDEVRAAAAEAESAKSELDELKREVSELRLAERLRD